MRHPARTLFVVHGQSSLGEQANISPNPGRPYPIMNVFRHRKIFMSLKLLLLVRYVTSRATRGWIDLY